MEALAKKDGADVRVTSAMPDGDVTVPRTDDEVLGALGYRAEFKREFGLWSTFCVSFAVLGLLPSFASTLYYGMGYAGTGGEHVSSCSAPRWLMRSRDGVGVDHRDGVHPVCGDVHGGALLRDADEVCRDVSCGRV